MQNFRILLFQFYRPQFLWNVVFSAAGLYDLYFNGIGQLVGSFLIKFMGYVSCVGLEYYFSNQTYFYYRNAGYSVRRLYGYSFALDFSIYLLLVALFMVISSILHA
jgi:hypothetical protein